MAHHHSLLSTPLTAEQAFGRLTVQWSSIASLTFLAWDILITFDDEVKFIWPKPWNLSKYLYLFTRYCALLVQISTLFVGNNGWPSTYYSSHDCYIWEVYQALAAGVVIGSVDIILILRVIALYHENKIIRSALVVLYIFEIVGMGVGLGLAIPGINYDDICLVITVPWYLFIYGGAAVAFQVVLFSLTMWKFLEAIRSGWGDVPLLSLLMRDGTWAFFLLMATYIGQASLYALKTADLASVMYGWVLTIVSFSGYRILLNLNRLSPPERQSNGGDPTNTDIEFTTQIFNSNGNQFSSGLESMELSTLHLSSTNHAQSSSRPLHSE